MAFHNAEWVGNEEHQKGNALRGDEGKKQHIKEVLEIFVEERSMLLR
jgi:hypothetical protein